MRRQRGGFTLIEMALAIGLIAVGLAAIISTFLSVSRKAVEVRIQHSAAETARSVAFDGGFTSGSRNGYHLERRAEPLRLAGNPGTNMPATTIERITVTVRLDSPTAEPIDTWVFYADD